MKYALTVLIALAACTDASAPARLPNEPSLNFIGAEARPATPTPLSATLVGDQIALAFVDNTSAPDEYSTCARFTTIDEQPVTTQCLFAIDYDVPTGSTGARAGNVTAAPGAYFVRLTTWRHFQQPDSWWADLPSIESASMIVENAVPLSTKHKGGRK